MVVLSAAAGVAVNAVAEAVFAKAALRTHPGKTEHDVKTSDPLK